MATSKIAFIADESRWLPTRPGERCLIRVGAEVTNGAYSVVEIVASPGYSTSMHLHRNEDEHVLVLEGKARIACGDETIEAAAGEAVLSRNVPHAWGNPSDSPLRILVTTTPGGLEEILPADGARRRRRWPGAGGEVRRSARRPGAARGSGQSPLIGTHDLDRLVGC